MWSWKKVFDSWKRDRKNKNWKLIFDNFFVCRHFKILDVYMQKFIEKKKVLIPIYLIESSNFCYENNSSTRECKKEEFTFQST